MADQRNYLQGMRSLVWLCLQASAREVKPTALIQIQRRSPAMEKHPNPSPERATHRPWPV